MTKPHGVPMRTIRRVAAAADCDIRTATKIASGQPVRGLVGERVVEAFRAAGVTIPAVGRDDTNQHHHQ